MHKIGITTIIIVLLHAVLMIDSAYAGQPVVLTQGQASYSLGKRLEYLVDPTGRLTIDDVLSSTYSAKFQSSTVDVPHFGFTKSSLWFRVDLRADRTLHPSQLWLLESQYPLLNWIDVYLLNDKGEIQAQHGGNRRSFHNRSIITRHPNFNLEIPPGEKRTLFVNIRTEGSAVVPLVLWDAQAFMKTQQDVQLVMGLYFGGIIAMLAINLLALVVTRDASFVYYIFHLSSIGLFFFAMNGYLFQYIFPDRPEIAWHASLYLAGITCFAMLQFCRSCVDFSTQIPRANTIIN